MDRREAGLEPELAEEFRKFRERLEQEIEISKLILFGSRARGGHFGVRAPERRAEHRRGSLSRGKRDLKRGV
jgi:hypothetical protein